MKINIASSGRYHVLDLARELDKLGFDVRFYSYVLDKRASVFGLRKKCNASLFLFMAPFLILQRLIGISFMRRLTIRVQDFLVGSLMRRCDVFIAMSGRFVYAIKRAQHQGAIVILERGSKHILDQKRILDSVPGKRKTVSDFDVKRELQGYQIADYISIASLHVKKSFEEHHFPTQKLVINPYGVDLSMFSCNPSIEKKYDVLMVGNWGYQKGCDLIIEAIKETRYSFLHVGTLGDIEFPNDENFLHIPSVDQPQLILYYNQARILILPSRQEGLALVQAQAIACGLPVVCTKDTGGRDIGNLTGMRDWIFEMKDFTVVSLKEEMKKALEFSKTCSHERRCLDRLSWEAYGERYAAFLRGLF